MIGQSEDAGQGLDIQDMGLPRVVRAQLQRRRGTRRRETRFADDEIERRVRDALYGKSYHHPAQRRVYKELEGHHVT